MNRPTVHWPSVRGRARADAGPLLLAAIVVVFATFLAAAVPPLMRATADTAVQNAVNNANDGARVAVTARWEPDDAPSGAGRVRFPRLAEGVDDFSARATDALGPGLRAVVGPPIATVTSDSLKITDGSALRTFQLTYLAYGAAGGPRVTWIAGGPPQGTVPANAGNHVVPDNGPPWPIHVGLSEVDAEALGARPGTRIPLRDEQGSTRDVQVSGVFRADDPNDPAWRLAPGLLRPITGADGMGTTRFGGLLSADSLPDARLALHEFQLRRTVWFTPDPGRLSLDSAESLAATVVALKASSGSTGGFDSSLKWETRLDTVLRDIQAQVAAASAQASVLLVGVLAGVVPILLLAAELLVRRREPALVAARQRGASLPDLGGELLLESVVMGLASTVVGIALARTVAPGVSWAWAAPVILAAIVAGPAYGVLAAARATRDRRTPANRSARRWIRRTKDLRRAAMEAAVLVAAVVAVVALHQRGILPADAGDGLLLPASAPALGVLAAALVLVRLLPVGASLWLRRALRSRRPLAVFAAARAAATSARLLPFVVLAMSAALASFALVLNATTDRGLADGAWRTVGADARLDVAPAAEASTPALAQRIAAAPGVRQAVAAQVTDRARVAADLTVVSPRLVVVDALAYQRLLADTPLPDGSDLARLTTMDPGGGIPALVRSGTGGLRPGMRLDLLGDSAAPPLRLIAVGTAPAAGEAEDVVIVDSAALATAGRPAVPNTVWVVGPGAGAAVKANADAAKAVVLTDVLQERRAAPLTSGLLRLTWTSAATLLILGLLGIALGAAANAPDRWQSLTRLRTLGLRPREARWIAAGELLPPVALAAISGPALGLLVAHLTLDPLALRRLTGQAADPALAVPWLPLGLVTVASLVAVTLVVPVESALRRRRRLADVLRAGDT